LAVTRIEPGKPAVRGEVIPATTRVAGSVTGTQLGNLNEPMRVCQLPDEPFVWLL